MGGVALMHAAVTPLNRLIWWHRHPLLRRGQLHNQPPDNRGLSAEYDKRGCNSATTTCTTATWSSSSRLGGWRVTGLLDRDKAWAGPADSNVALMAFWGDMTGPAFWQTYRIAVSSNPGHQERVPIYHLLWCLEYDDDARHAANT